MCQLTPKSIYIHQNKVFCAFLGNFIPKINKTGILWYCGILWYVYQSCNIKFYNTVIEKVFLFTSCCVHRGGFSSDILGRVSGESSTNMEAPRGPDAFPPENFEYYNLRNTVSSLH